MNTQVPLISTIPERIDAILTIEAELGKAERKFPTWPIDLIHGAAILCEESGEAIQEAIDIVYADGTIGALRTELAQAGAMAIRALIYLERHENTEGIDVGPALSRGERLE